MKNVTLSVSISVDGAQSSVTLDLAPVGEDLFQPTVDLKLANGLESKTKMPASSYNNLRNRLEKLAKATDPTTLQSWANRLVAVLSF